MFLPLGADFDWGAYHAGDLPYLFTGGKAGCRPPSGGCPGR